MSPGYLPFAGALDLPAFFCDNCGFWQRHFAQPQSCPLCLDARHVVPQNGWSFRTIDEARSLYPCHWEELETDVWRFWNDPVSGIGSTSYLLCGPSGNLMFEGCAVFSDAALDHVASLGGVRILAASHPHSYGALWQIQDRFDPEVALHPGDLPWSSAICVTWPFDNRLEPLPDLGLHLTGGHFDGHTVLFDSRRRILFCGDALKFELDPTDRRRATTISTHKAFVRGVPLTPGELGRYRDIFAPLDFAQTWTPFEQVRNSGRREALALIDAMLSSRPHARPVRLSDLAPTPGSRGPAPTRP